MRQHFGLEADSSRLAAWAEVACPLSPQAVAQYGHHKLYPVLRLAQPGGAREFVWMREGLIPSYACDDRGAEQRAEAHAEAMTCDACFRSAFLRRRCVVPATILHEQRHLSQGIDQPCSFALESGGLFGIAGVWERWTNDQGHVIESFAIVTAAVTPVLRSLFERMPVVLTTAAETARWLAADRHHEPPVDLLKPLSVAQLREWRMSPGAVDLHLRPSAQRAFTPA